MVPRSFSPAMELGAMAITPLKSIIRMSMGSSLLHTMAPIDSSLAWLNRISSLSARLMSKRLLMPSSKEESMASRAYSTR